MNLSAPFIQRPVMTTVLALALLIAGWIAYLKLPVSDLPSVDFPTIVVTANLPGASPDTMATTVATPLERQFSTLEGLQSMNSVSSSGSTRITLQFDLSRNIDTAAQDVQTAIAQIARRLPRDMPSLPTLRKVNPTQAPIFFMALSAPNLPMTTLDEYAETVIAQRLSAIPGVAQVLVFGSQKYAVRIYLNPAAMAARGLGMDQVVTAIQNGNSSLPSGTLEGTQRSYTLQTQGQPTNADTFNNMIVAYTGSAPIRLADIGRAENSVENNKIATWFNNQRAIVLAVQRQPGANTVAVAKAIRALLPQLEAQMPGGMQLRVLNDRSVFINESLHDVKFTLVLALALVVGVVFLFLRNVSSSIVTLLVLPTSLLGTFVVMDFLGYSLDNLSLMALTLAIGFIIDDAIVVLENIMRHMEMGKARLQAVLDASREIGFTVISMTLSLSAVFIPILFMGGVLGRLFREFAVTVGIAVLFSGMLSLTLIPMLSRFLLRPTREHGRVYRALEDVFDRARDVYGDSLRWSMRHRGWMLLASVLVLGLTVFLYGLVQKGFIPRQDTGVIFANVQAPEGITFPELTAKQRQLAGIVLRNPNVDAVMTTAGQALGGISGSNIGRLVIHLKPRDARAAGADTVIRELRQATRTVRDVQIFFRNPPAINIGTLASNSEYQYVLQGPDLAALQQASRALETKLKRIHGLRDVNTDLQLRNPQINVQVLNDRAAALGVTLQQVQNALYTTYGGRQISTIFGSNDEYEVIADIDPAYQKSVQSLDNIYVHGSGGKLVPLASVARISVGVGPLSITHYGQMPSVTLSFNLAPGVAMGDVAGAVQAAARDTLPAGVTAHFAGSAQAFQQSMHDLPLLLILTIFVIYMVLAILYEHFGHPLTILTALPLAGFGALLMLFLFHEELNIFSFVGIIMLVGLVKKNGIIMVDFALETQRERGLDPEAAIVEACLIRFRPIMMTTLAAILATLPIALGLGAGAETRRPLGIAVVGGLIFSQFLTLYITPTFYVSLERLIARLRRSRDTASA